MKYSTKIALLAYSMVSASILAAGRPDSVMALVPFWLFTGPAGCLDLSIESLRSDLHVMPVAVSLALWIIGGFVLYRCANKGWETRWFAVLLFIWLITGCLNMLASSY